MATESESSTTVAEPLPPRDEAGRFAAAIPDAAPPVSPTNDSSTSPAQDSGEDVYAKAFAEVVKRHQDADESTAPVAGNPVEPVSPIKATEPVTPAEPPAKVQPPLSSYDEGMDAQLYNLLKAEKKLPPSALWAEMSDEDRTNWSDNVKHIRNARNRNYNAGRENQPGGKQTPDSPISSTPADLREEIPEKSQTTAKPSDAGQSQTQLPPEVQEDLTTLSEEYGEDSAIYRSSLRMAIRNEERIAEIRQVTKSVETERETARIESESRRLEDNAARSLTDRYPQLKDSAKLDLARQEARDYADMRARQRQPVTSAQAMEWAAKYHFSQENVQQAQQARDSAKDRSLSGTFSRTNRPAPPTGPVANEDEAMSRIFASLQESYANNRTGSEARNLALRTTG